MFEVPEFARPQPDGSGGTLPKEVEGAIELGCIRPDLLTMEQAHMLAWFGKRRLEADRKKPPPSLVAA